MGRSSQSGVHQRMPIYNNSKAALTTTLVHGVMTSQTRVQETFMFAPRDLLTVKEMYIPPEYMFIFIIYNSFKYYPRENTFPK